MSEPRPRNAGEHPQVHLYAQCWNEEFMLPFFFRHYDPFVERYVIFDDGSTDGTLSLLRSHPRVDIRPFPKSDQESFVNSEQALSNECWKESRGEADWVIVTDVDEHLYHPQMVTYLTECAAEGVSIIPALGFQMIRDDIPSTCETLCEACTLGAPWAQMMKCSVFAPSRIREINFSVGRHVAAPLGEIVLPRRDEVMLLHYKYINLGRTHRRHLELLSCLRQVDLQNNWGHKYKWSFEQLKKDWAEVSVSAVEFRDFLGDRAERYPLERWWREWPRVGNGNREMRGQTRFFDVDEMKELSAKGPRER